MRTPRATFGAGTSEVALVLLLVLAGCSEPSLLVDTTRGSARLSVRASPPTEPVSLRGEQPLGEEGREGVLLVPEGYEPGTPAALVVLFHGAGGTSEGILKLMRAHANATGTLVLAPKSSERTWDLIARRKYGADRERLDATLARVFREYAVDPERVTISGFSDGASYALSLGLTNGDLFRRIAAFSAGGVAASELVERPAVFLSHGTSDPVLPIDLSGRFIAEQLRDEDYRLDYREFEGAHAVPDDIARDGFAFLVGAAAP